MHEDLEDEYEEEPEAADEQDLLEQITEEYLLCSTVMMHLMRKAGITKLHLTAEEFDVFNDEVFSTHATEEGVTIEMVGKLPEDVQAPESIGDVMWLNKCLSSE
jgi:molecular chaperone GrpE (heat shock protein)